MNGNGRRIAIAALAACAIVLTWLYLRARPEPAGVGLDEVPLDTAVAPAPPAEVTVYFSRAEASEAVRRVVAADASAGPEAALRALLAGPTAEERASGIDSWFSAETAGLLRSFALDESGTARVDFAGIAQAIPNASSSAGSELLLRELNSTLFQFPEVQAIEYTSDGSCEAFWNWLQYGCEVVRRPTAVGG